jgi:hypothetical protein
MIHSTPSLCSLLRIGLLALLMLGVGLKPMLAPMCEIHALGHALHLYGDNHDGSGFDGVLRQLDQHKVRGAHGLLHEGDAAGVYVDNAATIPFVAIDYGPILMPVATPPQVPFAHIDAPFRPPIA